MIDPDVNDSAAANTTNTTNGTGVPGAVTAVATAATSTAATNAAAAGAAPECRAPRILFVPVSGAYGMGEYARSLAIARAARRHWQGAAIRFVLSREAPYAAATPFPTTLLASSPTFHSAAVIALLEEWRPDVVIFDNAGRTAQLRAARRLGARIVYISARPRQRRKAFRWRWIRLIDEHWIAYPEFIAGRLRFFERLKLGLAGRPIVRYLDVILSRADLDQRGAILSRTGCGAGTFVLVVPGGGTGHPGADDAVGQFLAAARSLAARGVPTVYVGPKDASANANGGAPGGVAIIGGTAAIGDAPTIAGADTIPGVAGTDPILETNWHHLGPLPQAELAELMHSARLIVANGGSTLLQAIACGNACIAVPIAKDQTERTRRCVAAGVAAAAALDAASIVQAADRLLQNEPQRAALAARAARLGLADGIDIAMRALDVLVGSAHRARGVKGNRAERHITGLRSPAAVIPASHAHTGRNAGGGRLAGTGGALSQRPLRTSNLGAPLAAAGGRCGGAAPDQIERAGGASVRLSQPAAGIRFR